MRHIIKIGVVVAAILVSALASAAGEAPEYKRYMEKQPLKPIFLTGKDTLQFRDRTTRRTSR